MVSLLNIQVHLPEKYSKTPLFILTNLNYRFLEIRAYQCYGPQRKIMVSTEPLAHFAEPLAHFAGTLAKSFGKLLFRQSLRLRSQLSSFRLCFCFANPCGLAATISLCQSLRLRSQFSARNPYEVSSLENFRSVLGIGIVT